MSCGPARSRADGVTIVFGPIKIFFDWAMAFRTSSSHTKSVIAGCGGSGGGAGAVSVRTTPLVARNRSTAETIWARSILDGSISVGIGVASTAYASRLMLIKCRGLTLSLVELPATAPQPSVIAGNRFVAIPVEPVGVGA